jgi:hypothetical protein
MMHLCDLAAEEMPKKFRDMKDCAEASLHSFATEGAPEPSIYDTQRISHAGKFFASYYRENNPEECEKWQLIAIEWSEKYEALRAIEKAIEEQTEKKRMHASFVI